MSLRVLAVDWSGAARGAAERRWMAEAADGQLLALRNGIEPADVVTLAAPGERAVVGLDFAFSFPHWFARERGWTAIRDVWRAARDGGEAWLAASEPPFFGRAGSRRPAVELVRRGEPRGAKSVFQIAGAGAVGTGSIRGMPLLETLAEAGWGVWPFFAGWPLAVEIYPAALVDRSRRLVKTAWRHRLAYLTALHPQLDAAMRERAAGSEDAFDAAISALAMDRERATLQALRSATDPAELLEGRIWLPSPAPSEAR
jgi:hypothetical protein